MYIIITIIQQSLKHRSIKRTKQRCTYTTINGVQLYTDLVELGVTIGTSLALVCFGGEGRWRS